MVIPISPLSRVSAAGRPAAETPGSYVNGITHRDDLAGLNLITVPEVLIECGNMRNATDAALLTSPGFQREIARALEAAIIHFLGEGTPAAG